MTRSFAVALTLLTAASPAAAQWTRVMEVPASDVHSVYANGNTIVAGGNTVVYVSTNAGATWKQSAMVAEGVTAVRAVLARNGRVYAGTSRQGIFVSDNFGDTWLAFNEGLVGGIFNTQLDIFDLLVRGDSLYAATEGDGVWVRNIAGVAMWSHYGELIGDTTADIVSDLETSDTRLLASASVNGSIFFRDWGAPGWTQTFLNNVGFVAGLAAIEAAWTGHGWVVGCNGGLFRSSSGQEPWTPTGPDIRPLFNVSFAVRGRDVFADLGVGGGSLIEVSRDDGATWQVLDSQPGVFIYKLAMCGSDLYAGRLDGLWRRSTITDVPPVGGAPQLTLGPNPFRTSTSIEFSIPNAEDVQLTVYDVRGRLVATVVNGRLTAGLHRVEFDGSRLASGVYYGRLAAGGSLSTLTMAHIR